MKKVMLTIAGMLFIGVVASQAQSQDTTVLPRQDTTVAPEPQPQEEPEQQKQEEGSQMLRDRTTVSASEIPAALRETLQAGPEYKGWDDPTTKVYRNEAGDEFTVEIMDGTQTKSYRFDKNGKPIEE